MFAIVQMKTVPLQGIAHQVDGLDDGLNQPWMEKKSIATAMIQVRQPSRSPDQERERELDK